MRQALSRQDLSKYEGFVLVFIGENKTTGSKIYDRVEPNNNTLSSVREIITAYRFYYRFTGRVDLLKRKILGTINESNYELISNIHFSYNLIRRYNVPTEGKTTFEEFR